LAWWCQAAQGVQVGLDGVGAVERDDVVDFAGGGFAVAAGEAAVPVAEDDLVGHCLRRVVAGGAVEELAEVVDDEAAQGGCRVGEGVAAQAGRDGSVADQFAGLVGAAEGDVERDDDVHGRPATVLGRQLSALAAENEAGQDVGPGVRPHPDRRRAAGRSWQRGRRCGS
jgi:hypothetical protein